MTVSKVENEFVLNEDINISHDDADVYQSLDHQYFKTEVKNLYHLTDTVEFE
jgi:hypothetical protein